MKPRFAGIDPGSNGAIAVIDENVTLLYLQGWSSKTHAPDHVADLLHETLTKHKILHAYVEKQQSMPKQGVKSTFTLGTYYGAVWAAVQLARAPYTLVPPTRWKRKIYLVGESKKETINRAMRMFIPKRKITHHEADALFLAYAALKEFRGDA